LSAEEITSPVLINNFNLHRQAGKWLPRSLHSLTFILYLFVNALYVNTKHVYSKPLVRDKFLHSSTHSRLKFWSYLRYVRCYHELSDTLLHIL